MKQFERGNALPMALPVPRHRRWDPADASPPEVGGPYTQGALALTFPLLCGLDAEPASAALSVVAAMERQSTAAPDPRAWASRFLQAVVEVVSSDRPLPQLARWTDPLVFAEIARRRQEVAGQRSSSQLRSGRQHVATVHIARLTPTAAEVAARVTAGPRSRALAARIDYSRNRWVCTALDFG